MSGAKITARLASVLASVVLALGFVTPAQAGQTKSAEAQVAIVRPLSFFKIEDLNFGTVLPSAATGTVIIDPTGARTKTGSVTLMSTGFQASAFAGMGTNNQRVDISLGASQIFITGPGAPMRVHTFVIGSTPTAVLSVTPMRFRINSATGAFTFPVGATLDVGANQAPGTYTGNWNITLNYQ